MGDATSITYAEQNNYEKNGQIAWPQHQVIRLFTPIKTIGRMYPEGKWDREINPWIKNAVSIQWVESPKQSG
jgi:hypothetical protein